MTKKHYERAALIVQGMQGAVYGGLANKQAEDAFVRLFAGDNPRFDEARFRAACVPGNNVKARPRKAVLLPPSRATGQ